MSEADNAGDIFRLKLGNLPAKAAARLTLRYVQEVDVSSDKIGTFMLPRALNPRYVPKCCKYILLKSKKNLWTVIFHIARKINVNFTGTFLKNVFVKTHIFLTFLYALCAII